MLRIAVRPTSKAYHREAYHLSRSFHLVTVEFVNLGPDGKLISSEESVTIGDPHEAYVMIRPEIGRIFQASNPDLATMISPNFIRQGSTVLLS
jgi:hypothetical protein